MYISSKVLRVYLENDLGEQMQRRLRRFLIGIKVRELSQKSSYRIHPSIIRNHPKLPIRALQNRTCLYGLHTGENKLKKNIFERCYEKL